MQLSESSRVLFSGLARFHQPFIQRMRHLAPGTAVTDNLPFALGRGVRPALTALVIIVSAVIGVAHETQSSPSSLHCNQ